MKCIRIIIIALLLFCTVNPAFTATAVELMNEGKMLLYKGDIRQGIKILEEANRMDNKNLFIKLMLAKGYSWNNEWDKAKSVYGEVVSSSSTDDQIYWDAKFGIAQITSWEKRYSEAINLYREILTSDKNISKDLRLDISLAIGDIYSWEMKYDAAIEQFNNLLSENPGNLLILNRLAKIYLWKGEYEKSREYTNKVLSINKTDSESAERIRVLDQIQTFTATIGYDYTWYDSKNNNGDNVRVHKSLLGFEWQYSVPLKVFSYVTEATQNSIESADTEKSSAWNSDVNIRAGGSYRINTLTYISAAADYASKATIFPDFSSEISISRKLTQNIDIEGLYKYTYDKLDSIQTVDKKQYHLISPGIIFYYNPEIYNRIQFYVESDTKDLFYSVLMQQYLSINPENIVQFYMFLSQGRTYLTFSDTTVLQKTTTYSATLIYTHFFNSSWGIEFATGLTTSVNSYSCYHGGINIIYKW